MMDVAEILDKMIARLQDKGWVKGVIWEEQFIPGDVFEINGLMSGSLRSIKGKACLHGTFELCGIGSLDLHSAVADRLAAAITALFPGRVSRGPHWTAVVDFNDHDDTTFEDVMLVVKHARESCDA